MIIELVKNTKPLRHLLRRASYDRSTSFLNKYEDFLSGSKTVLDIGAGFCTLSDILSSRGYSVTPLDVQNVSLSPKTSPILYDGKKLPFEDNNFDATLIITVLHHTPSPETVIKEALRVSRKIVIIEDVYRNTLEKYVSFTGCSILNAQFIGHPHSNKDDKGWKKLFDGLGLKLRYTEQWQAYGIFHLALYCLEK